MVNSKLLAKELEWYDERNIEMKSVKYNRNIIIDIFNKYNDFGMVESSYCCNGKEHCCWQELVEEGNWDLTLEAVKRNILRNIKESKKYLYNGRKYGSNRLHIGEKDGVCYMYIYLRDVLGVDYSMWFSNK